VVVQKQGHGIVSSFSYEENIMRNRLVFVVAMAFLVACVVPSVWASSESELEEECRTLAIEEQIAEEEIEQYVKDCVAFELGEQEEEKEQPVKE
jgi:hypothetical protein